VPVASLKLRSEESKPASLMNLQEEEEEEAEEARGWLK
jgi:hypothetical protein